MSCYPNPVSDILYLDFDLNQNEEVQILITDLVGKQITLKKLGSLSAGNHKYQLETASYLRGMYTLSLKTKKGMISKKIVVI